MVSFKYLALILTLVLVNLISSSTADSNLDGGSNLARQKRGNVVTGTVNVNISAVLDLFLSNIANIDTTLDALEALTSTGSFPDLNNAVIALYAAVDALAAANPLVDNINTLVINIQSALIKVQEQANALPTDDANIDSTVAILAALDAVSLALHLALDSGLLDCSTIDFPLIQGGYIEVTVIAIVGQLVCSLNTLLTQLCTTKTDFGLEEILVSVLTLVFYLLYRLCSSNVGFALFGVLGLDMYNNRCLMYAGPYNPRIGVVNFTKIQDIVVLLLIGVHKLGWYACLIIQPWGAIVLLAIELLSSEELNWAIYYLVNAIGDLVDKLGLNPSVDAHIDWSPISGEPNSKFTVANFSKFTPNVQLFLFILGKEVASLLHHLLNGLLCTVEEACSTTGLGCALNNLAETVNDFLTELFITLSLGGTVDVSGAAGGLLGGLSGGAAGGLLGGLSGGSASGGLLGGLNLSGLLNSLLGGLSGSVSVSVEV